jgi:hypothetical protein
MNRKNKMDLDGAGLWDYVKNVFTANDRYNNKVTAMLKKYGDYEITNIEIVRTPIMSIIDKALNLVSFGKFDELKKKYNYDDMNHLYAIFTVNINGIRKPILVEKNEVINVDDVMPIKTDKTESLMIGTNKGLTINSLLDNTLKAIGKDNFFIYDGFGNKNCQSFLRDILQSNGIYNDRIAKFVFQPMQQFSKELGKTTTGFSKIITDTGAFFNRLLGKGDIPETYLLVKSNKLHKKYDVINENGKKISFGDNRYTDYTINKNDKQKELYLNRHKKEDWTNLNKAGAWSRYLLWNRKTLKASIKDMEKLFKIHILLVE